MTRKFQVWLVALTLTSGGLCFAPLLNLLAFEFSFAMGLPFSFFGAWVGVQIGRSRGPLRAWLLSAPLILFAGLLTLIPISLNALRVRNCNFGEGLIFFAMIPLLSAWVSAAFGVLTARRGGIWTFTLIWLGALGLALRRLWTEAPVDAFSPFLGYYPGPLYDDVIPLGDRLLTSRLEDLTLALAAVGLAATLRARKRWPLLALGLLAALGGRLLASNHDVHRDAAYIQARLGGETITEHLRVYHPGKWSEGTRRRMGWELEFAYAELGAFFGRHPEGRVDVYLYPSRDEKKRLMGAGRTRVAKPWQRAMHIHAPKIGDGVTVHEMAHIFSADIADPPHHLSLHRGLPNMALIEGLAVAATWDNGRLTRHQWSAALRRIKKAPKLKRLLAPQGFWAKSHGKAYTLSGSFVRFYRDLAGVERMSEAYRTGCFEDGEGRDLDDLLKAWREHLDALPLSPLILQHAKDRFDRPAIFRRVCAHEIAALRRRAQAAKGEAALALQEEILGHIKRDVKARLARIKLLVELGRLDEARAAAAEVVADPKAGAVARHSAELWLIDIRALEGDLEGAELGYAAHVDGQLSRGVTRALAVKQAAAAHPEGGRVLDLMLKPHKKEARREALDALVDAAPDWGVAWYLRGRSRGGARRVEGTSDLYEALEQGLPHEALRFEARRLIAHNLFALEEYSEAGRTFAALLADAKLEPGERFSLERWRRRAQFFQAQASVDRRAAQKDDAPQDQE